MSVHADLRHWAGEITQLFTQSTGVWVGCDWPTDFGSYHLDLAGLSAAQAVLMARATAGKESSAWHDASLWLARIEHEALEAETEARAALDDACRGDWVAALEHARTACDIEARYHTRLIWQPLRDRIEAALRASSLNR